MKAYMYGSPTFSAVKWAFWLKAKWTAARFAAFLPLCAQLLVCLPIAWLCVKLGTFGHWLASAHGVDSHERWE